LKDNHGFVFVEHRLFAATEIDDAEAAMPQAHLLIEEIAEGVGTSMRDPVGHRFQESWAYRIIRIALHNPADPAHKSCPRLYRLELLSCLQRSELISALPVGVLHT
jgi:hypothetical protein